MHKLNRTEKLYMTRFNQAHMARIYTLFLAHILSMVCGYLFASHATSMMSTSGVGAVMSLVISGSSAYYLYLTVSVPKPNWQDGRLLLSPGDVDSSSSYAVPNVEFLINAMSLLILLKNTPIPEGWRMSLIGVYALSFLVMMFTLHRLNSTYQYIRNSEAPL